MLTVRPSLRAALSIFAAVALLLSAVPSLRAQYQITSLGATITENFNTYTTFAAVAGNANNNTAAVTASAGFSSSLNVNTNTTAAQRTNAWSYYTASSTGANAIANNLFQNSDNGSSGTGGFRSYGPTGVNNANFSADRALGILGSGSFGTFNGVSGNTNGVAGVTAQFTNATGGTITSLVISFTGEQWRGIASAASFLTVGYSATSGAAAIANAVTSPLNGMTFNSIVIAGSALNGDNSANRNTPFTATINGLNILSGSSINLAFVYAGGGSRQGLAIDDLSIIANGIAAAASLLWSGSDGDTWSTALPRFNGNATTWDNSANATTTAEFANASGAGIVNVGSVTAGGLKFSSTGFTLSGGTITDGNTTGGFQVAVTNAGDTATVNSAISGTNGLTKTGAGTLVLGGGTQSALGGAITVASGTLQSDTTTLDGRTIANNGTLNFNQTTDGSFSGTLANSGTLIKSGTGNLTINTAITGTGATSITGGKITAGIDGALATGALSLASGTTLDLATHNVTVSGVSMTGSAISIGAIMTAGATPTGGILTIGSSGVTTNADATTSSISGGTLALGSGSRSFTVNTGSALTVSSNLMGSGTLTKAGAGTLTLTGTNSGNDAVSGSPFGFTGGLSLTAGTVKVGNSTAIGSGQLTLSAGTLQDNGTALSLANKVVVGLSGAAANVFIAGSNDITFTGAWQQAGGLTNLVTVNNTGSTTLNGTFDLNNASSNRTLTIGGTGNVTINGAIYVSSPNVGTTAVGGLTKTGSSTLTLNGANTYNGNTTLNAGTLIAANNTALGVAQGAGNANVFVNGGDLVIANGVVLGNAITMGTLGTITGNGTAALGGTVSGTGTLTGTLAFNAGSAYTWSLSSLKDSSTIIGSAGTDFSQLTNTGSLSLLSGALLNLVLGTQTPDATNAFWSSNRSWTLISSTGSGTITGSALSVTNSQSAWASLGSFTTSLTGNNLTLDWTTSAVPEPSTYAAILGAVALTGVFVRRRRQAKLGRGNHQPAA
jgi:autotransporter-associated beta strand protein